MICHGEQRQKNELQRLLERKIRQTQKVVGGQGLVTQCRFYEQYTTQEALLAAAQSHSSRKMKIEFPSDLF